MKLVDRLFTKARGQIGYGLFVKSRKLNVAGFNALLDERIVAWCDG